MEENDVKITCAGPRLEFKIEKFFIQNLTRRKKFISKSVALYFFSIQNLTRCIFFQFKI